MKLFKLKLKAWFKHLLISLLVLTPVFLVIFLLWFPQPFFQTQSVIQVVVVLIAVDLVLGPLLTFVVYRPQKKGLKFDLTVIVLVQLAAIAYGLWSIQSERPAYVVFAVDRYEVLAEKDVDFAAAGMSSFGDDDAERPVYAFAQLPMGRAFQAFQDSVLIGGRPDLERRPEFWLTLAKGKAAIMASARPVSELMAQRPAAVGALQKAADRMGLDPAELRFVPLVGKQRDFAALLDPETAHVSHVVAIDNPWID
jgi:hypothetical protein